MNFTSGVDKVCSYLRVFVKKKKTNRAIDFNVIIVCNTLSQTVGIDNIAARVEAIEINYFNSIFTSSDY